ERALQMAEAGANAYINEMVNGFINTTGGGAYDFMPKYNPNPANWPVDLATFRQNAVSQPNTAPYYLTHYPAGQIGQGFWVGHVGPDNNGGVTIYSYGWCNGATRMVEVSASAFSIFDWAAAYGIDPYSASTSLPALNSAGPGPGLKNGSPNGSDTGPAWNFS